MTASLRIEGIIEVERAAGNWCDVYDLTHCGTIERANQHLVRLARHWQAILGNNLELVRTKPLHCRLVELAPCTDQAKTFV